jgi:hypothetical protein
MIGLGSLSGGLTSGNEQSSASGATQTSSRGNVTFNEGAGVLQLVVAGLIVAGVVYGIAVAVKRQAK